VIRQPNLNDGADALLNDSGIFNYSDGDEVECRLLATMKECSDLGSASTELSQHIVDWPSEYHLSPIRHNLLRLIQFDRDVRVLELGCGCGAMTRYLGESGAEVIAVDGSVRRAQIAAERCRDLPNVRVVSENLMDFETDQRFDVVTLIGVLEYAPRYISAIDPVVACLEKAQSLLKPDGVLVLAIENQLGLKYFNGCAEDHLGAPYYGLHGFYRDDEPTTFGRAVLEEKLVKAGLPHHRFYYPFPDYKLPQVILSDDALSTPEFDAAALLAGLASGNAEGEFYPSFHENLAWRPIISNGLLPQLANSFLVFAAASEDWDARFQKEWLACVYASGRIPAYATETRFARVQNAIVVEKKRLYPDAPVSRIDLPVGGLLHRVDTVCDYLVGRPYLLDLQQRLGRGEGVAGVVEWAAPWLDVLVANSSEGENARVLPGDWVDASPQNFIFGTDGSLRRIDDEWKIEGYVSLAWLVIRGLVNALGASPTSAGLQRMKLQELIQTVAASRGINLSENDFCASIDNEANLQSAVRAERGNDWRSQVTCVLSQPQCCQLTRPLMQIHFCGKVTLLESEIRRVKSSFSWQITKPLRLLVNLPRIVRSVIRRDQEEG